MSHFVIREAQGDSLPEVVVHGPLYLYSWDDSLWHEYRVQALEDTPENIVIQEIQTLAELPVGVTEVETLLLRECLWWRETWHQVKYHRYRVVTSPEGDQILQDSEIAWVLPRTNITEYTSGLGIKSGIYFQGQDGNNHKYWPVLDAENGVVILKTAGYGLARVF